MFRFHMKRRLYKREIKSSLSAYRIFLKMFLFSLTVCRSILKETMTLKKLLKSSQFKPLRTDFDAKTCIVLNDIY